MSPSNKTEELEGTMGPVITREEGIVQNVQLGYNDQLTKNRSLISILGMTLAIVAIPYGIGGPLMSAIYGCLLYTSDAADE